MTDPADIPTEGRESLTDDVSIAYEPLPGGKLQLSVFYDDTPIHSAECNLKILGSDQLKGQFINRVTEGLAEYSDVDTDAVAVELRTWFAEMHEMDREGQAELLPEEIKQIINGTHYPVEVHGGETTTWHVTLTFAGRTRDLEFTTSEIVSGSGGALREKIANEFFEIVEIEQEDWEAIRDRWQEHKEVVNVVNETTKDAVADRVLENLGHNVMPVPERDKMANSPSATWYDPANTTVSDAAPADASILWVQNSFLVDQLEASGKSVDHKATLIKTLNTRGDIYGIENDGRKRWPNAQGKDRAKFYPFDPDVLGITEDEVGGHDDPNHSEVEA